MGRMYMVPLATPGSHVSGHVGTWCEQGGLVTSSSATQKASRLLCLNMSGEPLQGW